MDTEDYIVIGAAVLAAYYILKKNSAWSDDEGLGALEAAGLETRKGVAIKDGGMYASSGDTTFKFLPGDFARLNWAQRALISVDKVMPGEWLTRAVLS